METSKIKPASNNRFPFALAFTLTLSLLPVLAFQNCGPGFNANKSSLLLPVVSTEICFASGADACLINKNSWAQSDRFSNSLSVTELAELQRLPANLRTWAIDGQLRSTSFIIFNALDGSILQAKPDGSWRYRFDEPNGQTNMGQIMSFFWANHTVEYARNNLGLFYAENKNIKIVVDDSLFGWTPQKNQIHLTKTQGGTSMSLDASILIYFLGLANLDYATQGRIHVSTTTKNVACPSSQNANCCSSISGCSRALASGQADYLVGMIFQQHPAVAEDWGQSESGQVLCNSERSRNLAQLQDLTVAQAFEICQGTGESGNIYSLGAMYASLWWSLRNSAGISANEVDRLYMLHLSLLDGDDDFVSVKDKILSLDQLHFGSRYRDRILIEFSKRGL